MPCDYSEYPRDWPEISERIRNERAGGRCECTGQCGHHHPAGRCTAINGQPHPVTESKVVLTVAHYPDRTKGNVDDDNLLATCQRCHLSMDIDQHVRNRRYGRKHRGPHQLTIWPIDVQHVDRG